MVVKTIYVVRHADRPWRLRGIKTPTGIPGDVALSAHGEEQVAELDYFFMQPFSDDSRPIPDRIYSSAYWRTLQTIRNIPCRTDRIYVESGLGERVLGDGLHPPIALTAKQTRPFPAIDAEAHKTLVMPPAVEETRADLIARMARVLQLLVESTEQEDPTCETILLGTHASPAIAIARALVGESPPNLHTYTAGTSKYCRIGNDGVLGSWKLEWNARTDYLSHGGESDWSWSRDYESDSSGPEHHQTTINGRRSSRTRKTSLRP